MSKLLLSACLLLSLFVSSAFSFGKLCGTKGEKLRNREPTAVPANFKIAFIGDAGDSSQQKEVLTLIKNWGADVVIHSGDFDYDDDPDNFEDNLNAVLGPDYPYFASIGNHDEDEWSDYQDNLIARMERIGADSNCDGDYGVNMVCNWNGFLFVLSGVGTRGLGHANFIDESLSSTPAIWKFVSWHKNQRLMQIGGKSDEVGWDAYDTTRKHGAIIATGHEHSYCRSFTMSNIEDQVVVAENNTINLRVGETFVFVSGLGGKDIRDWDNNLRRNPWWAAVGANDNGITDGALLCTFHIDNNPRKAHCYFEDRNGDIWDEFDIYSNLPDTQEELDKQLAEANAAEAALCRSKWVEYTVTASEADVEESEAGERNFEGKVARLRKGKTASLSFENVVLPEGAVIKNAFLQVYSAADSGDRAHRYVISGFAGEKQSARTVVWEHEDEGWEKHTVWVTPDIRDIVSDLVAAGEAEQTVTFKLNGLGGAAFYTFDESPCLAPTLAIQYQPKC